MAEEVDEEYIGPLAAARGPCFDACQVDAVVVERLQQVMQRTRLVAHRDNDRCLVVTGRWHCLAADDQKARGIVRAILDFLGNPRQSIQLTGHVTGNRGGIPLTLDPLGGLGVAGHRHALDIRIVRVQPLAALGQ